MDVLLKMVEFSHLVEYPHCCPIHHTVRRKDWQIVFCTMQYSIISSFIELESSPTELESF